MATSNSIATDFVIYRVLWRARSLLYRNRCLQIQAHFLRTFTQVDRLQKYVGKQLTQRDHSLRKFRRKSVNTVDAYSFPLGILGLDRNSNGIAHLSGIDRIAQTWKLSRTLPVFLRTYFKLNYEMLRQKTESWLNLIGNQMENKNRYRKMRKYYKHKSFSSILCR